MTDDSPSTERSLADRVDAIERALTDESTPAAPDVFVPHATSVAPDRVEALEADLADLRASVQSLRAVVGDVDRRRSEAPANASEPTATDAFEDDTATDRTSGPLHAPTGREIPVPEDTPDTDSTGASDGDDPTESDDGLLARVGDAL